jgi:DNA-binding NarL/FixJ family response regulator
MQRAVRAGDGRVVVADDHELVRDAVAELLSSSGIEVVGIAEDGDHAVELADELEPDVVVLDVRMPGMDGWEATARIRDRHPDVQVVVLSVESDGPARRRSALVGAMAHLAKGTPPGELCDVVARAIAAARGAGDAGSREDEAGRLGARRPAGPCRP